MPFAEQVRLLSLLPRSWKYEKTIEIFGCSRHAIKTAHRIHDEQDYILRRDSEPSIRQRADPEKIKHFVNWMVESNTLVSGNFSEFFPRAWYYLLKRVLHPLLNELQNSKPISPIGLRTVFGRPTTISQMWFLISPKN